MKLWILRPIDAGSGPWHPWYDRCFGFIVRAETEGAARFAAAKEAWDEEAHAWVDSTLSTCVELTAEGETGIVMKDAHSA